MEPPSPLISWFNPFPSRFINRAIFFCYALESHECACCVLSFLYFHWLFPLSARATSSGKSSIYKSTRGRVDSKSLCGRWRLHLMGSCSKSIASNSCYCSQPKTFSKACTEKEMGLGRKTRPSATLTKRTCYTKNNISHVNSIKLLVSSFIHWELATIGCTHERFCTDVSNKIAPSTKTRHLPFT